MYLLPKPYLYLSSFLLLLFFTSCKISKYKLTNCDRVVLTEDVLTPIIKPNQPLKYKATIDVLKNHLSGLLIVKQTDSITTHFVFVTELGMKMFDLSYSNSNHTMNADFVFEPLNKPKLVASLKRNFENMFLLKLIKQYANRCKYFYVLDKFAGEKNTVYTKIDSLSYIRNQEIFKGRKKSSKIDYLISSTTKNYIHIFCKQYGLVKIYIDLTAIG